MLISEAVSILAAHAEGVNASGTPQELELKKAMVIGAGALKSLDDCFGLPNDMTMMSIRNAIAGMGEAVENPNIFLTLEQAKDTPTPVPLPDPDYPIDASQNGNGE